MDELTTTPIVDEMHGKLAPRGLESTPSSSSFTGRFGRMFRNLPFNTASKESLVELGNLMIQPLEDGRLDKPLGEDDDDENTARLENGKLRLPAGYTYFGQFVDHDITFDPVSSLVAQDDPDALADFRTPRFDLDSLYGRGPADQPYLYQADGVHLQLGQDRSGADDPAAAQPDLQRNSNDRAIIGDPRNDENLIVSQLQVAFIRFHNKVVDKIGADNPGLPVSEVFKRAQRQVRWHYQAVVICDFLPRLVGQTVVDDILPPQGDSYLASEGADPTNLTGNDRRFFHWHEQPYMPVEFSVAAYRFGHSMIRPSYEIRDGVVTEPPVENASRIPLFSQGGQEKQSLNGFRPLPGGWGVDWKFFLDDIVSGTAEHLPQPSYAIDDQLSHPLGALPDSTAGPEVIVAGFDPGIAQVLAVRNLIRGRNLGLPSGQDVARAMGLAPLSDEQLYSFEQGQLGEPALAELAGRAPLWFYILREAKALAASAHLGPVGGRIVAEVLIGLLAGDPLSYLNVEPNWKPDLPNSDGTFRLSDLINFAIPAPETPQPPVYNPFG